MADWLRLKSSELNKGHIKRIGGVDAQVFLSPYDVPEAVRAHFDPGANRIVIEFRYMGRDKPSEPTEAKKNEGFDLIIGRNSKRLYGIAIDASKLSAERIEAVTVALDKVEDKIASLTKEHSNFVRALDNYDATRQAIDIRRDDLCRQLSAPSY